MYDGIDERIVDGGSLCYDCWDGLGIWRQDVGVPTDRKKESEHPMKLVFTFSATASNFYFLFFSFIQ